ncbi:M23 family metallopeptidase [Staphylococcus agnetis]|uniref:M23 family metallopeptidase n=1 Tax=Staphylococcus agnetis TaxID=985762 RepID=UPI00208FA37D|nr:M23 family metallopeptidase [Staphylococcus agnetis]MCO4327094.1 M23 family metallopeptidase [Staphylococcus agnetis]MCO4369756.1 M23 family metallopeptidase [Staphylococcus agnetis]
MFTITEITEALNQKRVKHIYQRFSKSLQSHISYRAFKKLFKYYCKHYGKSDIYLDRFNAGNGEAVWYSSNRDAGISMTFHQYEITSMLLLPIDTEPSHVLTTFNQYIMPVENEFYIFWGGDNALLNYHYPTETQRYAYDLVILKDGRSFHHDGSQLRHYYCFGTPVIAPSEGEVVALNDDREDQQPGVVDAQNLLGNYVILKHRENEFSLIAHLKQHSLVVGVGDKVKQGERLALCGNSGHSTEPHIHFQVMTDINHTRGKSMKMQFIDQHQYEKGDIVSDLEQMK